MPSFFSALRISITYAVVGAVFAEYAGAVSGLGVYMQSAKNVFRTDLVLAAVAVSSGSHPPALSARRPDRARRRCPGTGSTWGSAT